MKLFKVLRKFRVMLLIFFLLLSYFAINPSFKAEGVAIKSIEANSTASFSGLTFNVNEQPRNREVIKSINYEEIKNLEDYANAVEKVKENETIRILTDKTEYVILKGASLGISVEEVAGSNIRQGLELQGGTRVLVEPETKLSNQEFSNLLRTMEQRLNVYGLTDLTIKEASDLFGNKFVIVEIAGATKQEVQELVAKQGKFEAKIGNETVFIGGKKDVVFVCRNDGTCSGIRVCNQVSGASQCIFEFQIKLSRKAAQKHAEVTKDIGVNITQTGREYLEKPLDLCLDDNLVDSLQISSNLKGKETTDIAISGPGFGVDEETALQDALKQMNKLQTVLITGSLPVKLNIVKIDTISPTLGKAFVRNAFKVGLGAIIAVALVVFIRYRKLKIAVPMMFVTASEILIILGSAALTRYNLDLAAIAGIIAAVGTGVDDQIVIADEVMSSKGSYYNWKDRIKKAFFIIFVAYATTVAAMLPLFKAGAGLLTGFALATIAGVTIGVFITRPAFASIIRVLLEEE